MRYDPDRWLDTSNPIPKGAWRGFEHGPRNCIGQELAMLEMKIILPLMLRSFNVRTAYDDFDRLHKAKGPLRTPEGERAFQMLLATGKPADDMPARVTRRV